MRRSILAAGVAVLMVAPAALGAGGRAVDQTWKIHQVSVGGGVTTDKGTVSGAPFGKGTVLSKSGLAGAGIVLKFTEKLPGGTLKGSVNVDFKFIGSTKVRYSGTGKFTGGTGKYAGATGSITSFTGTNSGSKATLVVKGTVST